MVRAERFVYNHEIGDKFRILSTVEEDVYINRRLDHHSEILNRIAAEISSINAGVAEHRAVFQTAEKAEGADGVQSFQWTREYTSEFSRDTLGYLTVDPSYFMPMIRNVPVFPNRDLKAGDTWSAEGVEAHDFRETFGMTEPYKIPFTAHYTFLGEQECQGQRYPAFSVSYRVFIEPTITSETFYPVRIMGASDQVVYWDSALGQPVFYEEQFRMVFNLSNGTTFEYRGQAQAEIIEAESMDKKTMAEEIAEELSELGLDTDIFVRETDDGVTLSFENIQFLGDSSVLLPEEQIKLGKIGEILLRHKDRDILVGGHTALAGTEETRSKLSLERASVVADYLIKQNVRSPDRIVVRGYGAERPIADNRTETGMRRNRRVEITILEN
ncbi:MAG: OmpA family protein [Treponema sp.]|nr:OmpA family protein [Treponema sp.]